MIEEIQNYLISIYTNITFGQIQDTPDNLININLTISEDTLYFQNDTKGVLINLFVRDTNYLDVIRTTEEIINHMSTLYDTTINNIRIVNTEFMGSVDPYRDNKNRYYQMSTFKMLVEERR